MERLRRFPKALALGFGTVRWIGERRGEQLGDVLPEGFGEGERTLGEPS